MAPSGSTLLLVRGSALHNEVRAGLVVQPVAFNQDVKALVPKRGLVPKYLTHVVRGNERALLKLVTSAGNTAGVLDTKVVQAFEIFLPSEAEQRALVDVFDDLEKVIDALERVIAKKQAIKYGVMQHLMTGRTRLAGFTSPWREMRLGSVASCIRGVAYSPGDDLSPNDRSYTVRLLRSNNVQGGRIDRNGLQFVHERRVASPQFLGQGDIVVCMANGSRALVGKAALFKPVAGEARYTFGAFMGTVRTDRSSADPRYISELLGTYSFRNWLDVILAGSSINNLRPGDIENYTASLPDPPEQSAIADVLSSADIEIEMLEARLAKSRALKVGMMQQLLTGRVRLLSGAGS
jgi:type I restriction enzyme, S subunit